MIELAKHIEVLLLENDCVIVPGFGGFIAHNRPAMYKEEDNEFYPPTRTIGFNPQLVMNDGLLAQSYMKTYSTDFPDATRKIEETVIQLKEQLYENGQFELNGVGTLYYNIKGRYEFEPLKDAFFTPNLYGLERFSLPLLSKEVQPQQPAPTVKTIQMSSRKEKKHIPLRSWARNAVATVAAVLLFFVLSIPVENTYIDEASYASLGSTAMFDAIRNQSVATTLSGEGQQNQQEKKKRIRNNINTLKPVTVKTEKVKPVAQPAAEVAPAQKNPTSQAQVQEKEVTPKEKPASQPAVQKGSYIIIASLATKADADEQVKKYRENGYKDVQILESNGRYRIALHEGTSSSEAYQEVNQLRKNEQFKNAWVFTAK